jgi:peptide/nickel transport system substrate-binding protein
VKRQFAQPLNNGLLLFLFNCVDGVRSFSGRSNIQKEEISMKQKLLVFLSLAVIASMLLSACGTTTPATTEPVDAPAVEATKVAPAEEVQPAAPGAAAEEPTEAPTEAPVVDTPRTDRKGGWLDKIIFTAIEEVDPAVAQLEAGAIDMYAVAAEDAVVFEQVKNSSNLKYSNSYGSSNQILFNPVACEDTNLLNPFTNAKIREAMNWAIDRNYVSQEIMGGLGIPKYTALTSAFADYARYADVLSAIETRYAFDLEKAKAAVSEEMTAMGATLGSNGKWQYNGKPVTIIGLIRTEDKRKEIGNYFANQLDALGFTVDRQEKTRVDAGPIWQGEDLGACKFHYYTAGWISPAISRDDGNMFVQYNTGKMQPIPLFGRFQPSDALLGPADKLFTNSWTTMEERAELFKTCLGLSMQESWWGVWINDNASFSPYKNNVEVAYDLAGGIASARLWPYTIRFEGKEGGEMRIAQSGVLVQPWNPIAGSNWTDDAMVQNATMDWGIVFDPYTGLALPKLVERAEVVVEKGLPVTKTLDWVDLKFESKITVPGDAWVDWDAANQKFITADEKYPDGVTAKSKSTVYYLPELWDTTWHDGSKMSPADFVWTMIINLDGGKPESKIYDESLEPGVETFLTHFKGVRILSTDPLVIETYDDQYAMDAELSITDWFPSRYNPATSTNGMMPWHGMTPAVMAEAAGELAFSTDKAGANEIDWTSFIAGPSLETQVKYLDQAIADKYIPYAPTLGEYLSADEAVARYNNLKSFYNAHKHIFIGTGPYFVDAVYPVEGTITLAHYADYIFPADLWASFGEPHLVTATIDGPLQVKAGEETFFEVDLAFEEEVYPSEDIDKVAYVLYNAKNEAVAAGEAELVAEGLYEIVLTGDVTAKLDAGASKLAVSVTSKLVSIPAFVNYEFVVSK